MAKTMNQRRSDKDVITRMRKALGAKQRQVQQLQREQHLLRYQHHLLTNFVDSFELFRQQRLQALLTDSECEPELEHGTSLVTTDELALLQQLHGLPYSPSASVALAAPSHSLSTLSTKPVAPPEDPLWLLKQLSLLSLPPYPGAEDMTLPQLQQLFRSTVRELSLHMLQYEAGAAQLSGQASANALPPLQSIQQVMCNHLHLIATLCTTHGELITALQLSNSETGETLPEPPKERHAWVLSQLGLSEEQLQHIADSIEVFRRLLTPVLEELRQLQLQPSVVAAGAGAAVGAAPDPLPSSLLQSAVPDLDMPQPFTHGGFLQVQQKRSARMKTLLRKDFMMRTCFAACLYGSMSWVQIARVHVLMSPVYPTPYVFFTEVAARVARGQEAKGRRQQQQAASPQQQQATTEEQPGTTDPQQSSSC